MATRAAIRHLKDLRRKFKSWYLVLAAYNAGPERISRAIRRGKSRDFWELARKHVLPSETMDYIPKFMAAVIICSHYEAFGFKKPETKRVYPDLVAVKVKPGVSLAELAKKGSIGLNVLKRSNPQLKTGFVPARTHRALIWVPADQAEDFLAALSSSPKARLSAHAHLTGKGSAG
jgi:membrane-bound lytic murein transglycosylase D